MIEFTANVISEDTPFFVPPGAEVFQPDNAGGDGYIVSVEAANVAHAEDIIRAMFPRGTIDDGPHEVVPVAPIKKCEACGRKLSVSLVRMVRSGFADCVLLCTRCWGHVMPETKAQFDLSAVRVDEVEIESATGAKVPAERVRPAAFGPHLPPAPPPTLCINCNLNEATLNVYGRFTDRGMPESAPWCANCWAFLDAESVRRFGLEASPWLQDDACSEFEEDCGDCGRPIVYDYTTESWLHVTDPARGCFLIPPRIPEPQPGVRPLDWS